MQTPATSKHRDIDRLLRPRAVAIVGASATPGAFGASVLDNLERSGFAGELFLVNPKRSQIGGRSCLRSADDLPHGVDCAVLAIPRSSVIDTVAACARRGVGGIIIFSSGFAEAGEEGRAQQQKIQEIATAGGMIVEGPNCLGMVNYVDGIALTFVPTRMERFSRTDGIAIVSQSGAMAAVLTVNLQQRQFGISFSISTGNEAGNGVEDFVEYLIDERHTRVIAMIVEQFRHPRRFLELVGRARAAGKTIALLHPGSSIAARSSASTHTGAMAGDYLLMKTKVQHAGVLMVDTLEELVDVSDLLVRCPTFSQNGAAVFTESGAFKALTLDFCEQLGLALPPLSSETADALRATLPDFIPPTNPLDITAHALTDPSLYSRTLQPVLSDEQYGAVIMAIILTDEMTIELKLPPILEAIRELKPAKPVIFVAMDEGASLHPSYIEQLRELSVPFFRSPERAFRAVARLTAFSASVERNASVNGSASALESASAMVAQQSGTLPEYKSKQILRALGIAVPRGELATTVSEALNVASQIGYPVVLKAQASALSHKSDVGGVALNLKNAADLVAAWKKVYSDVATAAPNIQLDGLLVEEMGEPGIEMIVGARNDLQWGPILLVGFGGVLAEALNDVRLLAPELSHDAIMKEIHLLKCAAVLRGFRGTPAMDVNAVAEIASKLGRLVLSQPLVREVDINPVAVYPKGAIALDALIVVEAES